jgi:hypothetical protein
MPKISKIKNGPSQKKINDKPGAFVFFNDVTFHYVTSL